jgi:mannosylglucosylglycerate synthase
MKTVAILHYAAPPGVGGVESTISHHARLLADEGYRVRVIAGVGEPFDPRVALHLVPEIGSRHPEVLALAEELRGGGCSPAFHTFCDRLAAKLRTLLAGVDVCIVHNALTLHKNLLLTAALFELNRAGIVQLIAWCHDLAWLDPLYAAELRDGYPWDLLRTPWDGVHYVVVSRHRQSELARLLGFPVQAIDVISPGVDVAAFLKLETETRHLVEKLNWLSADPLMLLPARITRRKNIEMGLRITASLRRQGLAAELIVSGPPGPHNPTNAAYLAQLQSLRRELDLVGSVHLLYEQGDDHAPFYVSDAMMSDLYQLADLLLFPSRYEGFGIPVLEAALARLPVFAADIPPVRESGGMHVHLFGLGATPDAVACSIESFLSANDPYRLRRSVKRDYTWQAQVAQGLIPLLEKVGSNG